MDEGQEWAIQIRWPAAVNGSGRMCFFLVAVLEFLPTPLYLTFDANSLRCALALLCALAAKSNRFVSALINKLR